jgi:hypothetical protein
MSGMSGMRVRFGCWQLPLGPFGRLQVQAGQTLWYPVPELCRKKPGIVIISFIGTQQFEGMAGKWNDLIKCFLWMVWGIDVFRLCMHVDVCASYSHGLGGWEQ